MFYARSAFAPFTRAWALTIALLFWTLACQPDVVVGEWPCSGNAEGGAGDTDPQAPIGVGPVAAPWSTGFENGYCDYARVDGFCYADPGSSYTLVTSPVHSGRFAAAFRVSGDQTKSRQVRCVRQGQFPSEAYYSAYYFVPAFAANNGGNWNLIHYQGGKPTDLHGIWDISVSSNDNGELRLYLFDFLSTPTPDLDAFPAIPIGEWFQIEIYFRRASDATGELTVFQDGVRVYSATRLVTDDTTWGQWYVGNFAAGLMPPDSTVYVDDVMIREAE